ncbi:LLM class flavin-dependent oxidoreductase [Streptomyces sp. UP1A-1]|nr:LLM class flavin-dependent oxidoreductase [Streptomyces sp. UP1A-1]
MIRQGLYKTERMSHDHARRRTTAVVSNLGPAGLCVNNGEVFYARPYHFPGWLCGADHRRTSQVQHFHALPRGCRGMHGRGSGMTSYSVLVPFLPRRPEQMLPYAGLVHWTQAERLWQGQALLVEPHQGFAHAAGSGFRVPTGLGVTLMPLRHPFEAALQARSLAMTTGQPVTAGFGPGAKSLQQSLLGAPYASPLTAAREYLTVVRGLLANELVDVKGEYVTCHGSLPPFPAPPVEIGLGVLRLSHGQARRRDRRCCHHLADARCLSAGRGTSGSACWGGGGGTAGATPDRDGAGRAQAPWSRVERIWRWPATPHI